MPILSHCTTPGGLYIETHQGRLAVTPRTSRCIHIRYTLDREFSARPSLMALPAEGEAPAFTVSEDAQALRFSTADVVITVDRRTAAFNYYDKNGTLLTREPDRGGKTLDPVDVIISQFDGESVDIAPSADGLRMQARDIKQVVDRQAYHAKLEFVWAEDEALYGLGSHEEGMLNLRGQHQYLYQENMKAVVPTLVSTRGYGILLDNYSLMTFHDDAFGSYLWMDVASQLDYYFVYGPQFDTIVTELRKLTGRPPMLPRWAFGYVQSKERYVSQAELVDVVKEYRGRGLPLDCIVLDWKSWTGDLWGQKTFDPQRFPDPDEMTAELHRMNAKLMISIWPIMRPGGPNWTEMHARGYLLGNQATYNAFDAGARACYWKQANEGLWSHGLDAWWCDCTEPFEADWQGAVKPEPDERMRINTSEAKRYLDPEFISAYSLLHSQGIYEGQRALSAERLAPDRRVVNLTRSAYMGQQRYGTVTWSGDVAARWETLRRQIADGLNFCVTGSPYWTTDVGGFFVENKPDMWFWSGEFDKALDGHGRVADLGYRELYIRWFQFGAFLPMFRSHGTDVPRELWRFGEPGDETYDALVKALRLRYQLLPYIYSLAGWTTLRGYTMLRNLAFDFCADTRAHNQADEFMFGPAFLVGPVTEPVYYGPHSTPLDGKEPARPVYLPETGGGWFDFWTGKSYAGGRTVIAAAPLDTIPLFVRAGSIVPMGPVVQHSREVADIPLVVHVFEGADGEFDFYDDAGDGYNYEVGEYTTALLQWQNETRLFTIAARLGSFPGMPVLRELTVVLHGLDGESAEHGPVIYDGGPLAVQF